MEGGAIVEIQYFGELYLCESLMPNDDSMFNQSHLFRCKQETRYTNRFPSSFGVSTRC